MCGRVGLFLGLYVRTKDMRLRRPLAASGCVSLHEAVRIMGSPTVSRLMCVIKSVAVVTFLPEPWCVRVSIGLRE